MPRALISGITGQDGSYLTELLLEKGYEVHGIVRRATSIDQSHISSLHHDPQIYNRRLFLHHGELSDPTTIRRIILKAQPDELYHLAGQSHVGLSFEIPEITSEITAMGTLRLLEMLRDLPHPVRFFHASSSEIFGVPAEVPQTELTPVRPVSPYGCAKAFATRMTAVYRDTFGMYACNGILYNHESPRRGHTFVTRKICRAAAAIALGRQRELALGDTSARRDWGHARDYVKGMWLALQPETAEDYLFATGELHSVQEVVEIAFATAGLDWRQHLKRDERLMRPAESKSLVGDASRARQVLGWKPECSFHDLIQEMTRAELNALK